MARALVLAVVVAMALPGCSWRRSAWRVGLGSWVMDLTVYRVVPRGQFLEATLYGHGLNLTVYTPDSEECRFVLQLDEAVDYLDRGVGGRFLRNSKRCDAVGVGDPITQRARQPRGARGRSQTVPRELASFRVMFEDDEVFMLRGRFLLANRVGWSGGHDSLVVVPNSPACRAAIEGGTASMEFRAAGRDTLVLLSREGRCRIVGLVIPPAP